MSAHTDGAVQKPPSKFQVRREKTRADLLLLGMQRFPIKGFSHTSIEDVVRDSGYTRGAFYFHFDSKEDFFLEVLRARRDARGDWRGVVESSGPTDLPSALMVAQAEFARTDPYGERWTMLIAEFTNAHRDDESLMAPLRALHAAWAEELAWLLAFAQEHGWCRTDRSALALATDLLAITTGYGVSYEMYGQMPDNLMDLYTRLLEPR
ncbi:TetR/AcrR family transcriptional regulator [Demequina sp. NBRC 110055]|uniref:TetR/AcrR family transcriptional regulator n=1 Tax=Demequina sp. NBRC 110055 TaxID=1570344 RepID=UPI000A01808C|nr:TetR/AcrR family transcriptional regulator [Demequina sp. NBRC 110055]